MNGKEAVLLFEINTTTLSSHRHIVAKDLQSALSTEQVSVILADLKYSFRVRVFDPFTTLFTFLSQIFSEDPSCRNAVSGLIISRMARGLTSICLNTGSLCKAKQRLPLEVVSRLTKQAAIVHPSSWKLGRVFVIDGTAVSMPDTPANRLAFPAHTTNTAGFPLARLAALFSLESGSLVDTAMGPMKGKGTGEISLMNKLWDNLQAGDTLLGDSLFSGYATIYRAQSQEIHLVAELPKRSHGRLN